MYEIFFLLNIVGGGGVFPEPSRVFGGAGLLEIEEWVKEHECVATSVFLDISCG